MSPVPHQELENLDPSAFSANKEPKDTNFETKNVPWTGDKLAEADSMLNADDCVAMLIGAINDCDKDQPMTYGAVAQGDGCIERAIEVATSIHEGDPPWNQHVKAFPPPEVILSDLAPASLVDAQIVCSRERGSP